MIRPSARVVIAVDEVLGGVLAHVDGVRPWSADDLIVTRSAEESVGAGAALDVATAVSCVELIVVRRSEECGEEITHDGEETTAPALVDSLQVDVDGGIAGIGDSAGDARDVAAGRRVA